MRDRLLAGVLVVPFAAGRGRGARRTPAHVEFTFRDPDDRRVQRARASQDGLVVTTNDSGDTGRVFAVDPATGETVGRDPLVRRPDRRRGAGARRPRRRSGSATSATTRASRDIDRRSPGSRSGAATRDRRRARRTTWPTPTGPHNAETLLRDPRDGPALRRHQGRLRRHALRRPAHARSPTGTNRLAPVGDGAADRHRRRVLPRRAGTWCCATTPGRSSTPSRTWRRSATFRLPDQEQGEGIAVDADGSLLRQLGGAGTRRCCGCRCPADAAALAPRPRRRRPTPSPTPRAPVARRAASCPRPTADRPRRPGRGSSPAGLALGGLVVLVRSLRRADPPAPGLSRPGDSVAAWLRSASCRASARTSPDQPGWTRRRAGQGLRLPRRGRRRGCPPRTSQRVRDLVIPPAWERRLDPPVRRTATSRRSAPTTPGGGSTSTTPSGGPGATRRSSTGCWCSARRWPGPASWCSTDLGREGMPLERACAAAVRLLDLGYFRIGNDVYADENGSFGLTTLERRHVRRHQERAGLRVRRQVRRRARDRDRRRRGDRGDRDHARAGAARTCGCCPTRTAGRGGRCCPTLVNEYVRATHRARGDGQGLPHLARHRAGRGRAGRDRPSRGRPRPRASGRSSGAMKEVSSFLGNTPTLARSSYVDPRVIEAYEEGRTIADATRGAPTTTPTSGRPRWSAPRSKLLTA